MKTICGTPGYVAPEILENRGYESGAVDMWSVGVILYILLCGFPPFYEEELPALFEQILHARYDFPFPWWDEFSQESKDLVRKLLELSPSRRLTAAQVRDGLPALTMLDCGSQTLSACEPFLPAGAVTPVAPCQQDDSASGDRQGSQEVQRGPEAQESSARSGRAGEAGAVRKRERFHARCTLVDIRCCSRHSGASAIGWG